MEYKKIVKESLEEYIEWLFEVPYKPEGDDTELVANLE